MDKISIIIIVAIIVIASIIGVINARYDGPKKIKTAQKLESIYGNEDDFFGPMKKMLYCIIAAPWIDTDIFYDYFDFGKDYNKILAQLSHDKVLKKAIDDCSRKQGDDGCAQQMAGDQLF